MSVRVLVIFAVPATVVTVVFVVLGVVFWWPLLVLAIPAAALTVWWLFRRADSVVLRKLACRPLGEIEGERLRVILERLCLTTGIDEPELRAVDDEALNLAVVSGRTHTLVVTAGLLQSFEPLQLEGAAAHGLSKIASGFGRFETLIASAPWAVPGFIRRIAHRWSGGDEGVIRFDIDGVGLTRYPPGLRSALERIEAARSDVPGGSELGTAWLVPPVAERISLDHRIEVLGEL